MNKILFYDDKYYMFSNFSAHEVKFRGITYKTAEHCYQSQKFTDPTIQKEIENAASPLEAKELANGKYKDKFKKNWHEIKVSVMKEIVTEKALQYDEVRQTLLSSDNLEIIENSPNDYFWGWGKDHSGRNEMGKIWKKVRSKLRSLLL